MTLRKINKSFVHFITYHSPLFMVRHWCQNLFGFMVAGFVVTTGRARGGRVYRWDWEDIREIGKGNIREIEGVSERSGRCFSGWGRGIIVDYKNRVPPYLFSPNWDPISSVVRHLDSTSDSLIGSINMKSARFIKFCYFLSNLRRKTCSFVARWATCHLAPWP